ncbi:60s acidic ribosomal protein-domain-containing protein, partial [Pavlovales sp. CCMP2436]
SSELACVYAALALHDDGVEITAEKISSMLSAAGVTVEPYWPSLFAKLCVGKDLGAMISSIGAAPSAGAAAAPVAAAAGGGAAPVAAAAKAAEPEEEEEEAGDFGLFD